MVTLSELCIVLAFGTWLIRPQEKLNKKKLFSKRLDTHFKPSFLGPSSRAGDLLMGWLDSQCNFRYFPKNWPGVTLPGNTVPYRLGNCPVQPAEFNQQNYFQKCCFVGVGVGVCGTASAHLCGVLGIKTFKNVPHTCRDRPVAGPCAANDCPIPRIEHERRGVCVCVCVCVWVCASVCLGVSACVFH